MESEHVVAVVDLLLTVGYLDGQLHAQEEAFIRGYVDQLVTHFAPAPDAAAALRLQVESAYDRLDGELSALAAEVTSAGDTKFTSARLKTRAVALFHAFPASDQETVLSLLDAIVNTDGKVTPEEQELHDELRGYFAEATVQTAAVDPPNDDLPHLAQPASLPLAAKSHPLLDAIELPYPADPAAMQAMVASDYNLIFTALTAWEKQRSLGNGRLMGVTDVAQLPLGTRLLDGHVHVMRPDHPTELIVLGDLHGCYACFKAALLQSNFIERAYAYDRDPAHNVDVQLVLLGDYLDRGRFGFEGVLRAALQLLVALPHHVTVLRGNHELLVRVGDHVVSAVNPAEAVPAIADRVPVALLEAYRHLFEHMPSSLLCERILFVHGGIPRDDSFAERYQDLGSLDDSVLRFEMMWGDPVPVDRIAVALQRESPRFGFGREQFRAFMAKVGANTLIRGHEAVDPGFVTPFDLGTCRLHTLFSAGGGDNADLPPESRYRSVTPAALTIANGVITPWAIDYRAFAGHAFSRT